MRGFGELESAIMERLWAWGTPSTVREVVTDLQRDRQIAYTTVMTVMEILHRKGWLVRERDGRAFRYSTTASREEYTARLMREALDESGDTATAFAHFVADMSEEEAAALRAALRRSRKNAPDAKQ